MAKKKAQPKKSNVTITMNGEVVLSIEVDNKLFKSFSSGFVSGISPFLSRMTQPEVPTTHTYTGMTPDEIQELFKKYGDPEVK